MTKPDPTRSSWVDESPMEPSSPSMPTLALVAALGFWRLAKAGRRDNPAFNDTELVDEMQNMANRRLERSVIARTRARLVDEGAIKPAGVFVWQRRKLQHFEITTAGIALAEQQGRA